MNKDMGNREGEPSTPYPSEAYAWSVVAILIFAYTISFVDRQIMSLLIQPIKADLQINDTMIGLLHGLAFAVFYTIFGIPIGRMADSKSRKWIIIVGISIWSAMTAACGLAKTFTQLLFARIGVGVGEASLSPSAYSMLSDYFPKEKRGRALSFYGTGVFLGAGLAFLLGGKVVAYTMSAESFVIPLLGELRPWQMAFVLVALPGIPAVLLMGLVKEPLRRGLLKSGDNQRAQVPLKQVFDFVASRWRIYIPHFIGFSMLTLIHYSVFVWGPEHFRRTYEWSIADGAYMMGMTVIVFATLGIVFGGWVADRLIIKGSKDAHMRIAMYAALGLIPVGIAMPLMPTAGGGVAVLCLLHFLCAMPFGAGTAALQLIAPNQMRAQISAIYLFSINIIGLGIGPMLTGAITDYVFAAEDQLRYSLATVFGVTAPLGALIIWSGLKGFAKCVEESEKFSNE
jgi:MFS family permease